MTAIAIDFGTSNTVVSIIAADTQEVKTLRFSKISRKFSIYQSRKQFFIRRRSSIAAFGISRTSKIF